MNTFQQKLAEQYVPLANKLAYEKKKTLPQFVDVEDLKSAAYLGLSEAASRFDPDYGVAFSTFAYPRIFGAIMDHLRQQGWGKRGEPKMVLSLDGEDESGLGALLEARPESSDEEFLEVVSEDLGDQAKEVLRFYFIDEYSMKQVGEKFGVTESRISQLIKRYKSCIRDRWSKSDLCEQLAA
jgi:RNA polymerase sigma factor (sigma-70 family)